MSQLLARLRHWLPPLGAATCLLLVGRVVYVGLTSPEPNLSAMGWIGAFLLVLAYGLYRRASWAQWIAATLCCLLGTMCFILLITRFFPPGIFGSRDAPTVERPSMAMTLLMLVPSTVLSLVIGCLLLPVKAPAEPAY